MRSAHGDAHSSEGAARAPCSPGLKEGESVLLTASWRLHGNTKLPLTAAAQSRAEWEQEVAAGVARSDVTAAPAGIGGGGGGANRA